MNLCYGNHVRYTQATTLASDLVSQHHALSSSGQISVSRLANLARPGRVKAVVRPRRAAMVKRVTCIVAIVIFIAVVAVVVVAVVC